VVWHGGPDVDLKKDFLDWLPEEREPIRRKGQRVVPSVFVGRNVEIFDRVRYWAYENVCRDGGEILAYAERVNSDLSSPLDHKEINTISTSITKFMQSYEGGSRRAGVMVAHFSADMTIADRQCAAAHRTNKIQTSRTSKKIFTAMRLCRLMEGSYPSIGRVCRVHKLAKNTVKSHLKKFPRI
jgi:hypothetical protein